MNLFIFLSICHLALVSSITIEYDMKMITDVLASFDVSLSVAALLSWPMASKLKFGRLMTKKKTPIVFLRNSEQLRHLLTDDKVLIIIDLENGYAVDYLKNANSTGRLAFPYRWLIIHKSLEDASTIPAFVNSLTILPNSEVIIARLTGNNSYDLRILYQIKPHKPWLQEIFGKWTFTEGLEISQDVKANALSTRRKNLQGEKIAIATVIHNNDTSSELKTLKNITTNFYIFGFHHTVHVFEFLNITSVMKLTNFWGYLDNGTWSGMVGEAVHGEAQFCGQVLFFTKQRFEVLEYLSAPLTASVVFVFREPRLSYQNNLFLLPFQASVWYSILGFTAIIILILYITAKWEWFHKGNRNIAQDQQDTGRLRPDFGDITIVAISAITQQGTAADLRGGRGRVVIFLLFLIYLFIYTAYSASIVVLLQSSSNQIRTLKDLLNSKLELGVEDTVYNRFYFMNATEPVRKAIYEKKIAHSTNSRFLPLTEGVRKLQTEPFAFNMYTPLGYRVIESTFYEHEKCGLREIQYIQDNKPWYTCRKNSPYKELFKLGLYRVKEHGLIDRVNRIFFSRKPHCTVRGGSFVSVSIVDFYPALLLLVYGSVCALVLLILEIFVHSQKKKTPVLTE